MLAFSLTLAAALAAAPQDPHEVLATYVVDGKPATISRTDAALELALHQRRRERGQQAIEQLVAATITRTIAGKKNLMPTPDEVRAFWKDLQDQFRAAGRRPEDFAAVRNMSESELFEYLAVQIAQERIVRAELNLPAKEKVGGEMLQLWLQEERKKAAVISDPDLLPAGSSVRVGTTEVPLIDLGLLLLRTAEDDERDDLLRRIAYMGALEALAKKEGIQVLPADLDASVQKRREEVARDPKYRGASLEQMLKASGETVASLRELRVFRAQVLLDKLARARFPKAVLAQELQADRQRVLDRVGPRRRVSVIFVRADAEPNAFVKRDFAAARKHLEDLKVVLQKESFENTARLESDHASSKLQGGDCGYCYRHSERLPEPVLAAAFALAKGELSAPVQTPDGCWLVKCVDLEAAPDDDVLLARWLDYKAQELQQQIAKDARLEVARRPGANPGPGAGK